MNSLLTLSTSLPHDNDVLAVVAIAPKKRSRPHNRLA
jgi:hypothetical protein